MALQKMLRPNTCTRRSKGETLLWPKNELFTILFAESNTLLNCFRRIGRLNRRIYFIQIYNIRPQSIIFFERAGNNIFK